MAETQLRRDRTITRSAAIAGELSEHEALLTIDTRRTLVELKSVAERTCDILLFEPPSFWVNDVGELQTDFGAIKIRVASVFRLDVEGDSEIVYRVVLEEIDDLAAELAARQQKPKRLTLWSRLSYFPWRRAMAIGLVLIAIPLVSFCGYFGARFLWTDGARDAGAASRAAESNDGPDHEDNAATQLPNLTSTTGDASTPNDKSAAAPARPTSEQLHLPGARSFVLPEVVAYLGLTPQQAAALVEVNDTTEQAVHDLDRLWQSDNPDQHTRRLGMILEMARQQSLHLLTNGQQRRLAELSK